MRCVGVSVCLALLRCSLEVGQLNQLRVEFSLQPTNLVKGGGVTPRLPTHGVQLQREVAWVPRLEEDLNLLVLTTTGVDLAGECLDSCLERINLGLGLVDLLARHGDSSLGRVVSFPRPHLGSPRLRYLRQRLLNPFLSERKLGSGVVQGLLCFGQCGLRSNQASVRGFDLIIDRCGGSTRLLRDRRCMCRSGEQRRGQRRNAHPRNHESSVPQ